MRGFVFLLTVWQCWGLLGLSRTALSSREHGSTSGKIGGALLGKIPRWSCGSSSAAAHLALPRWKEPPRPSSGSASSKHCVLYARAWVRLSNAFHRALAEMFHQSTEFGAFFLSMYTQSDEGRIVFSVIVRVLNGD